MKTKLLEKQMTFAEIEALCDRKGWLLPTIDQTDPNRTKDWVWLKNGALGSEGVMVERNHLFRHRCLVLIPNCIWKVGDSLHVTSCGREVVEVGIDDFKYCPFCGRDLVEEF